MPLQKMTPMLIVLMVCATVGLAGCNAFNEHNKEQQALTTALGPDYQLAPEGGEETEVEAPADGGATPDVEVVTVLCEPMTNIAVEVVTPEEGQGTTESVLNGEKVLAAATRIDGMTTLITLGSETEQLSFTIRKEGETYAVCAATYAKGGSLQVASGGTIVIERFNEVSGDTEQINAGTFSLDFAPDAGATKSAAVLIGGKAEDALHAEGSYYTDIVAVY
ncbi:MAG: hypothetical protein HYV02_03275 [Deltaproteobacteria bacterium]|nr:hypothetical protein [Deltaproteobacteria bacterium]